MMGPLRRSNAESKRHRQRTNEPGLGGGYVCLARNPTLRGSRRWKARCSSQGGVREFWATGRGTAALYPKEVWDELKVGNAKLKDPTQDLAFDFAERYKEVAAMSADLTIVHDLMADTLVQRVIDPDSEDDEADIYVLSLAVATKRNGSEVGVLTQERKDLPKKCSVSTACGHLEIVCLPMPAFLHREGIWALYK
jgi:hypothetical protein